MSDKFCKGDIVQLKSEGPKMTVEEVDNKTMDDSIAIRCQWFAGRKLNDGWFNPESLIKINESNWNPNSSGDDIV